MTPPRSVHAAGSPFLMSAMVRMPLASARSPQPRSADQNIVLHLGPQKRCGEPPCRARNGRSHHRHEVEVSCAMTAISPMPPRAAGRRARRRGRRRTRPQRPRQPRCRTSARSVHRHPRAPPGQIARPRSATRSTASIAAPTSARIATRWSRNSVMPSRRSGRAFRAANVANMGTGVGMPKGTTSRC